MNRLSKLIKEMPVEDLILLKKDLEKGNIEKILNKQIAEAQANKIAICPVCSSPIREGHGFHLQFGPPDLRKKATFDGADCLLYFLERIRSKKK